MCVGAENKDCQRAEWGEQIMELREITEGCVCCSQLRVIYEQWRGKVKLRRELSERNRVWNEEEQQGGGRVKGERQRNRKEEE